MRLPPEEPDDGINMTPIIDVVFLLLIFFLVATQFNEEEKELPVRLPEVVAAEPLAMTSDLVVNILDDGTYKVLQRQYGEGELLALLQQSKDKNPQQQVLIRGDGRAAWKYGVRVMGLCNKADVEYKVAALPEQ